MFLKTRLWAAARKGKTEKPRAHGLRTARAHERRAVRGMRGGAARETRGTKQGERPACLIEV
jgi:hypothetical protein